jgi:SAM-dependent methyltransferase
LLTALRHRYHIDAEAAKQALKEYNKSRPDLIKAIPGALVERAVEFGYLGWPRKIRSYIAERDVLDIGCGAGLHAIGYVVAGVRSYTGLDPKVSFDDTRGKNLKTCRIEDFGWSARQLMNLMPNVDLIPGTFENVASERAFDVLVLHNVTEHLHDLEGVFEGMVPQLRRGGRVIYNHHNYYCWSGHHQQPKTVDDVDSEDAAQRRYVDWAHLDFTDSRDDELSSNLNKIRMADLRALTERYFDILEWHLIPSTPQSGVTRLTKEIMRKYPRYSEEELRTQHVFCVATRKWRAVRSPTSSQV